MTQAMPDVRTPVEVSRDLVCSADEFHRIVDDIVTDAMSDCPRLNAGLSQDVGAPGYVDDGRSGRELLKEPLCPQQ